MKVAIIGNMNNNGFAFFRYLIDFGVDVELFCFRGEPEHFFPEADTWSIDTHKNRIHYLNSGRPLKDFLINRHELKILKTYDVLIGSGLSPYYLDKFGLYLDLFVPFGSDLYAFPFKINYNLWPPKKIISSIFYNFIISRGQSRGIRKAKKIICIDMLETYSIALKKLRVEPLRIHFPIVYTESQAGFIDPQTKFKLDKILPDDFVIMQHSRQYWCAPIDNATFKDIKHNNLLIKAISKLVSSGVVNVKCILLEYGPDVHASKALIEDLGISEFFIWLPLQPRKIILKILSKYVHVGADQFGGGYIGGTGYEVLACGKPLLAFIDISDSKFKELFRCEMPPVLNCPDEYSIFQHLKNLYRNRSELNAISLRSKKWFDSNCGIGLAAEYMKIIREIYQNKIKLKL